MLSRKAKKRLIVHLGYHKTGSSSIQEWLREHKPMLTNQMACYNLVDGTSNGLKFAANAYAMGLSRADAFLAEARKWANTFDTQPQPLIVLTDEALPGIPLGAESRGYRETKIYPKAAEIAGILARAFAKFDTTFILYEREPQVWLKSMHNQMVRSGHFKGDFKTYLNTYKPRVDWPSMRESIDAAIRANASDARLIACDFTEEFAKTNVRDMCLFKAMNLPEEVMKLCSPTLKVVNKSVSEDQLKSWKTRARSTRTLTEDEIKLAYLLFLYREPSEKELRDIVKKGTSLEHIRHMLIASREFAMVQNKMKQANPATM